MKRFMLIAAFLTVATGESNAQSLDVQTRVTERLDPSFSRVAEYEAPEVYALWWAETAKCLKLDSLEPSLRIQFFFVNASEFRTPEHPDYGLAGTLADRLQIFVGLPHIGRKDVIIHEMAHFLLYLNGKSDHNHPKEYFERCGIHTKLPLIPVSVPYNFDVKIVG